MATFDMNLYKRALKLEYLDKKYEGKWWLLPGAFHVSLCDVRCIGKTVEHSGIDEAWIQSGLYSDVVSTQIINGSHPGVRGGLAISANKLAEAFNIKDEQGRKAAVQEAHKELIIQAEHMNLEKQLQAFDETHATYPMYIWA